MSALIESFLRSPAAAPHTRAGGGRSLVDEMLGSAELREVPPGTDALFDSLRARYIASLSAPAAFRAAAVAGEGAHRHRHPA